MEESIKITRLSKAAREFNIGISTIVEFLSNKGYEIDGKPNTKLTPEMYEILLQEFQSEKQVKEVSQKIGLEYTQHETISIEDSAKEEKEIEEEPAQEDLIIIKDTQASFTKEEPIVPEVTEEKTEITEEQSVEETKEEVVIEEASQQEVAKEPAIEEAVTETAKEETESTEKDDKEIKVLGKIDLESINTKTKPARKTKEEKAKEAAEKAKIELSTVKKFTF